MIVDIHTHRWEAADQLGTAAAERLRGMHEGPWKRFEANREAHAKATKAATYAIVHGFISKHLGACIDAQQIAGYVKENPGRVLGFAGIDPMADDYMDEFDKAVELGLVGVTISPAAQGFHPAHTRAMALYEKCQQLGMPVFIHPDTHLGPTTMIEFAQPYLFDEVARSFDQLPLVFAQVGHPWVDQTLTLIGKHPNVYADLSDIIGRPWQLYNVLLLAYQQSMCHHLLLGSDFPFCTTEQAIMTIYSVNTLTHGTHLPTVPREQLRSIIERDTLACLGLTPPSTDNTVGIKPTAAESTDEQEGGFTESEAELAGESAEKAKKTEEKRVTPSNDQERKATKLDSQTETEDEPSEAIKGAVE